MKRPFANLNLDAACMDDDNLARHCVDREMELASALDAIESGENLLIYGDRGIGKSFLARLINLEIAKRESFFPVMVDVSHLPGYGVDPVAAAFPRAVLLQVCVEIWKNLLGHSFLELNGSRLRHQPIFEDSTRTTVREVYLYLIADSEGASLGRERTIGASAIVKSEAKEDATRRWDRSNLLPFEFFEFAEAIQNDVLKPLGKSKLVAICDEANLLSLIQQQEILDRYLELFLRKKVQFVFVAARLPVGSPNLPAAFRQVIELRGWPEINCLFDLITRAEPDISFTSEAVQATWEAFLGHPRKSLNALLHASHIVADKSPAIVDLGLMASAIKDVESSYRHWEAQLSSIWRVDERK
jgi:energy-coupling factor transporter ATP-binding protein EcfA2